MEDTKKVEEIKKETERLQKFKSLYSYLSHKQQTAFKCLLISMTRPHMKAPKIKHDKSYLSDLLKEKKVSEYKLAELISKEMNVEVTRDTIRSMIKNNYHDSIYYEPMAKVLGVDLSYIQYGKKLVSNKHENPIKQHVVILDKEVAETIFDEPSIEQCFRALDKSIQVALINYISATLATETELSLNLIYPNI